MATNDSRIGSSARPPSNSGDGGDAKILVRISPVIEREYMRRNAFVELRIDRALGATGFHELSLARARDVLADAEAQRRNRDLPRGIPKAYSSLASNLEECIKQEERRGLFDDPGREVARLRMAESPARLEVGDHVLYFDDDSEYGRKVVVVRGYDLYAPTTKNGHFIGANGRRFEYRYGYSVQEGDQQYFAEPNQLTREDCKLTHLRLVAHAPTASR